PGDRGMARPQDAGMLEIRASRAEHRGHGRPVERDGLRVTLPSAESLALHWIKHDFFKEGDYWRGRIDLRHLHDLWQLSAAGALDLAALRRGLSERRMRNAVDTQLLSQRPL